MSPTNSHGLGKLRPSKRAWSLLRLWPLALISFALLGWVLWRAPLAAVWQAILSAEYRLILATVPMILLSLFARAVRWRLLLTPVKKIRILDSLRPLSIGYLANNLLPARMGEVVRAYALSSRSKLGIGAVLATLALERVGDGLILIAVVAGVSYFVPAETGSEEMIMLAGVVFGIVAVTLLVVRQRRLQIAILAQRLVTNWPEQWRRRVAKFVADVSQGMIAFQKPRDSLVYLAQSLLIWSIDFLSVTLLLKALSIELTLGKVALVMACGAISTAIPSLPGYIGTYQFVTIGILEVLGIGISSATAFAFLAPALSWLTLNAAGLVALTSLGVEWRALGTLAESGPGLAGEECDSDE